jgi:hypothetical protein
MLGFANTLYLANSFENIGFVMGAKLKFLRDISQLPQIIFNVMTYFCINIIPFSFVARI